MKIVRHFARMVQLKTAEKAIQKLEAGQSEDWRSGVTKLKQTGPQFMKNVLVKAKKILVRHSEQTASMVKYQTWFHNSTRRSKHCHMICLNIMQNMIEIA
jgi:hypothetical protein